MRYYLIFLIVICFSCNPSPSKEAKFRIPPQWDAHEAIWFGWDTYNLNYHPIVAKMMKSLDGKVKIKVALENDSIRQVAALTLDSLGLDTASIEMHVVNNDLFWIRDNGAIFAIDSTNSLAVVDFDWGNYGYLDWYAKRNDVSNEDLQNWKQFAHNGNLSKVDSLMGVITNSSYQKSTIAIEGGGFEYNGNGVLIQCEGVTLQRNPGRTKEEIAREYKKLGIKKVIWLPKGLVEDEHIFQLTDEGFVVGGAGGHTDEFVRFVDEKTILIAWIDESELEEHPLNKINYKRMQKNYKILKGASDLNGKPFTIIKVPIPKPIEKQVIVQDGNSYTSPYTVTAFLPKYNVAVGDTLTSVASSSYLNFLVTNGLVLLPQYRTYGSPEKDKEVRLLFEELYPNREIKMLDVLPFNEDGGGGIHCATQQEPKIKFLK